MLTSSVISCLAVLAAAAPSKDYNKGGNKGGNGGYRATSYNANFDDLGTSVAALTSIGNYDGLNYQGIDLVTLGVDGTIVAGVLPKSSPNTGAFGATTILTQGQPQLLTSGTNTKYFDFQSFYFGCVAGTVESVASAPVDCTTTVTGYKAGKQVAKQSFNYSPGVAVTAPMTRASLSYAFKDIDHATFTTSYSVSAGGATLLDNLSYITYSSKK